MLELINEHTSSHMFSRSIGAFGDRPYATKNQLTTTVALISSSSVMLMTILSLSPCYLPNRETHTEAAYRGRTTLHTSAITIGERINRHRCVWRECECPDLVEVF